MTNGENELNNRALKSGTWYTISNILLRSVSIITAPIFTRLLTPSEYGEVSNFSAWVSIVALFIGLGFSYSIGRAKIDFNKDFPLYIKTIQLIANIWSICCFICAVIFINHLQNIMQMNRFWIILLFSYMIVYPSVEIAQTVFRYKFQYKQNIFISVFTTFFVVFFSLIFIFILGNNKALARIIGLILPTILLGIYFNYKNLSIKIKLSLNGFKIYAKYALSMSLPMIPHALAMVMLNQIDRIQIMSFLGSYEAGLYSFGNSYATLLSVVINAISQAFVPWLYEKYAEKKVSEIKRISYFYVKCLGLLTLIFILISPEALMILGSKEYLSSQIIVAPLALGIVFQFVYSYYSNLEIYHKKTATVAIGSILAALINYLANSFLIPLIGYQAAAYTTLLGYILLMFFHYFIYKITCINVFDNAKIFIFLIFTSIFALILPLTFNYLFIRIFIFVILLFILILTNYQKILHLLKKGDI